MNSMFLTPNTVPLECHLGVCALYTVVVTYSERVLLAHREAPFVLILVAVAQTASTAKTRVNDAITFFECRCDSIWSYPSSWLVNCVISKYEKSLHLESESTRRKCKQPPDSGCRYRLRWHVWQFTFDELGSLLRSTVPE